MESFLSPLIMMDRFVCNVALAPLFFQDLNHIAPGSFGVKVSIEKYL